MADDAETTYNIRPSFNQKFKPAAVKGLLGAGEGGCGPGVGEKLADKTDAAESAAEWCRGISDEIKSRCVQ